MHKNGQKWPFTDRGRLANFTLFHPQVSEAAFEVLNQGALDLRVKKAVVVAVPVKGQYILSYIADPKPRGPGKFRPILDLKQD